MKLAVVLLLAVATSAPATAQPMSSEIIQVIVVHLDDQDRSSRIRADARGGDAPLDDSVIVLRRENVERHAGMSLLELEALLRDLHDRGIAARWCQASCPLHGTDQRVEFLWAIATSPDRLLVQARLSGSPYHSGVEQRYFYLAVDDGHWIVRE